jgi:hypothetical protein
VGRVAEHHVQHIHTKIGVSSRAAAALFAMEHHLLVPRDMGGAALTAGVHHLVLYEPGLGIAYPAGSIAAVEAALAAGDPETGVRLVLVGIVGECRAEDGWVYRPGLIDPRRPGPGARRPGPPRLPDRPRDGRRRDPAVRQRPRVSRVWKASA